MSDQPTNGAGQPQGEAGQQPQQPQQQQRTQLPIVINAQYVKDLSFENPNAPQSLMPGQPQPQVAVNVDVVVQKLGETMYEVDLTLRAEAKLPEDKVAFLVEVTYGGVFSLQGVPAEHQRPILMIEGPRLLFPFARNVVAEAVRDGGFPPLLINQIDFAELYRRHLARAQQKSGEASQTEPAAG